MEDGFNLEGALVVSTPFKRLSNTAERCAEVESTVIVEQLGFEEK